MSGPLTTETRSFQLEDDLEPDRILRGSIESPPGAEYAAEPLPFCLVLHGFKGFMDWGFFPELSRRIAGAGIVAVRFNMSGSGVGEDPLEMSDDAAFEGNTPTREIDDTGRVRAFVERALPWADPARGAIFGHSLGGGVALLHAAERGDYQAVATWAAVSRVDRYDEAAEALWRKQGYLPIPNARTGQEHRLGLGWLEDVEANRDRLDIAAACGRLRAPTLLVHGTADESVPFDEAETLAAAFAPGTAELQTVEAGSHTFGAAHPLRSIGTPLEGVLASTVAWLRARLHPDLEDAESRT